MPSPVWIAVALLAALIVLTLVRMGLDALYAFKILRACERSRDQLTVFAESAVERAQEHADQVTRFRRDVDGLIAQIDNLRTATKAEGTGGSHAPA